MKRKNLFITAIMAVLLIGVTMGVLTGCNRGPVIYESSEIKANSEKLFYNDEENNLFAMNIESGKSELFVENCKILDVRENEVLVKKDYELLVFDATTCEKLYAYDGMYTDMAVLTKDYVYFKHAETNILFRMNRADMMIENVPMMERIVVNKFEIYNDTDIFFSANTDKIVRYNPETMLMMTYAEEVDVIDFSVDCDCLLYINGEGNTVHGVMIDNSSEVELDNIKAEKIDYSSGRVFYCKNGRLKMFTRNSH